MKILSAIAFAASLLCLTVRAEDGKPDPIRSAGLPVAELKRKTPVDFEKEILPLLKNSCLACHNTTKAKGGLNLETPQLITKGGDTGSAVAPGKSAESLLFKAASHLDPELIMPPKDNKANAPNLAPDQLALVKLWIEQGAKGEVRAATPVNWLDKPPALDPIFAVALTQDGQFAACGRGNRIDVYHVPSGRIVARLADAKLAGAGLTNAAHRDVVNSLAFNPDGTLLASASFREVKLWRRPRDVRQPLPVLTNSTAVLAVSPDRRWLATATAEYVIALHDLLNAGHVVRALTGHSNTITSLKFSPDSTQLCSGSADQTLRLWKASDGSSVTSIDAASPVHAVTWLAEGRQIASGGADGAIRIWSAPKLDAVKELKGHTNAVTATCRRCRRREAAGRRTERRVRSRRSCGP